MTTTHILAFILLICVVLLIVGLRIMVIATREVATTPAQAQARKDAAKKL